MVSICLCILWALLVTMLLPNKQPAGIIVSAIGAVLITVVCSQLGIK
ncbi:hypothetical protein PSPHG_CDS_0090 [Pseudomonas phage Psxphi15]